jgi:hypothetical protein
MVHHRVAVPRQGQRDYTEACAEMDRTEAGRRAWDLLWSHLTEDQRRQVETHNAFSSSKVHPDAEWYISQGLSVPVVTAIFRRGWPCGNVLIKDHRWKFRTMAACLHPPAPYPTDDIVLAQKILWESDHDEFIRTANLFLGGRVVERRRLFGPAPKRRPEYHNERAMQVAAPTIEREVFKRRSEWTHPIRAVEVTRYIGVVLDVLP